MLLFMKLKKRSIVALRSVKPTPTTNEKALAMMKKTNTPETKTG
jgi:hypothetical protein